MSDTMTTYSCQRCGNHFTRLTNMEPQKRVACTNSKCEGWMYPIEEPEYYYGPLDKLIKKFKHWLKYGWTGRPWL